MPKISRTNKSAFLIVCVLLITIALAISIVMLNQQPSDSQQNPSREVIHTVSEWDIDAAIRPPSKLGIHLMLDDGRQSWPIEQWSEHMTAAREIVGEWSLVTQVIRSDDLDPARWQTFMDLCAELHLIPILRLATTFDVENARWTAPPIDTNGRYHKIADSYAEFVAALQWPTGTHYMIVGNEPNHGNEWGGTPDPSQYARFLVDVTEAIHAADSQSVVMNGGFDPFASNTGTIPFSDGARFMDSKTFMDGMIAAEPQVFARIDAWATHSYPLGAFVEPPWQQTFQIDYMHDAINPETDNPPTGIVNRGINGYVWELYQLAQYGVDPLPVFITETGWRHTESTDPTALDGNLDYPDAETVSQFIDLALYGNKGRYPDLPEAGWVPWMDDPRIVGITFFTLDGTPYEWGHSNWLQMSENGDILGTYPMIDVLSYQAD